MIKLYICKNRDIEFQEEHIIYNKILKINYTLYQSQNSYIFHASHEQKNDKIIYL